MEFLVCHMAHVLIFPDISDISHNHAGDPLFFTVLSIFSYDAKGKGAYSYQALVQEVLNHA